MEKREMKQEKWGKKMLSFLLSLLLCIGIGVPAMAAGADGLTAAGAQAYLNELNKIGETIQYAGLMDMDANGTPELIVITLPECGSDGYDSTSAGVNIWTIKNGAAAHTTSKSFEVSTDAAIFSTTAPNGRKYLCCAGRAMRSGIHKVNETYLGAGGQTETLIVDFGADGNQLECFQDNIPITWEKYIKRMTDYGCSHDGEGYVSIPADTLAYGEGRAWLYDSNRAESSSKKTRAQLTKVVSTAAATPSASTYGPYQIMRQDLSRVVSAKM
ncbi:MAG: hypothetical protein MR451_04815, partial [Clostridiales bacterium]|nr:hypothetical protein [Clostridiales bacterium]